MHSLSCPLLSSHFPFCHLVQEPHLALLLVLLGISSFFLGFHLKSFYISTRSSSNSLEKEIDEYQDDSSRSEGSDESTIDISSCSDSSDEHYSSGVLGIPLEEFQELQRRMASGSGANSSRQPPSPSGLTRSESHLALRA